ncbi:MAG: hypothetical protein M1142_03450 [Patescibacteria group bacterium]|nr:hypothetical protein [Patescibacteria group bacterium]
MVAVITIPLTLFGQNYYENWKLKTQTLLNVKGSYQSFEAPSELFSSYKNYSDSVDPDALEKIAPEIDKLSNGNNSTSFVLYNYLNHLQINSAISNLQYIRGFWTFSIENKGTMKVENLALFVPFDGYYELTQNEATQSATGKFDKNIDIGDVKPSNSVFIKIWSTHTSFEINGEPYFSNLEDKPKVTFENGYKLVDFSKK